MRMCVSACLPVCVCICVCCGLQQLQDSLDGVCREWMRYEAELKVRTHNEVIMNKWTAPKWARVQCSICNSLSWPAQPQTLSLSHFVPAHLLTFYFLLNLLMSLPWLQPLNPLFFFFLVSLSRSRSLSSKVLQPPHHHWYFQHLVVVVFRLSDSVCICYNAHTRLLYIHYFSLFDIFSHLSLLLLVLSLFPFSLRMCWQVTGRI